MTRCAVCQDVIEEEFGKLKGTLLRLVDDKRARFVRVCSSCQKDAKWQEKAKIRGA